jgi:hypothetical protein
MSKLTAEQQNSAAEQCHCQRENMTESLARAQGRKVLVAERLAQDGQVEATLRASQPAKPLKSQPTAYHR